MDEVFYCKVFYHYENIPKFLQKIMQKWYMKNRHEAVLIYHKYIDLVNKEWHLTGEPCSFGEYLEDINPKYAKFVQDKIQPHIDLLNKNYALFKYKIDEYGDLVAYIPVIKNSKLWISLKEIES